MAQPSPDIVARLFARADSTASTTTPSRTTQTTESSSAAAASSDLTFGTGAEPAKSFNNAGFLALFAILAGTMVLVTIWFFVWARNGGFHWRKDEWEDYKSTVMRRPRGPDGRTISTVTQSRVNREMDAADMEKEARKEKDLEKALEADGGFAYPLRTPDSGKSGWSPTVTPSPRANGAAAAADPALKPTRPRDVLMQYREEKPAQVGGLNRAGDASRFDAGAPSQVASSSDRSSGTATNPSSDDRRRRSAHTRAQSHNNSPTAAAAPAGSTPAGRRDSNNRHSDPIRRSSPTKPAAASARTSTGSISSASGVPSRTASSYYAAYRNSAAVHDAARLAGTGNSPGSASASPVRPRGNVGATAAPPSAFPARSRPASSVPSTPPGRRSPTKQPTSASTSPTSNTKSYPPSAAAARSNRRSGMNAPASKSGTLKRAGAANGLSDDDDADDRLSTMLPRGEIHPNESASQIGTRAYWAAKRDSTRGAGGGGASGGAAGGANGYRRYDRS